MTEEMFSHYKLDIKEIDDQHWELIQIMNDIKHTTCDYCYVSVCSNCATLLNQLKLILKEHFEYEEEIMTQHSYPYLPYHKQHHNEMMILCTTKLHTKLGLGNRNYLMNTVQRILVDHIDHHDMQFGNWIKQQNQSK
jgi:hemerythrin-like metal-binding protein